MVINETINLDVKLDVQNDPAHRYKTVRVEWSPLYAGLRTFIEHFPVVFHRDNVHRLSISNVDHDWKFISNEMNGLEIPVTWFSASTDDIHLQKLINNCSSGLLSYENIHTDNSSWLRQILCVHRNQLEVYQTCSVSNLLIVSTNSENVTLWEPNTAKDLNLFLKHWMQGSNGRLERLEAIIGEGNAEHQFAELLNGMDFIIDSPEERRIQNCNGKFAIIYIENGNVSMDVVEE
ncbi:F-box associated domain-containing protein [Caenorhabditis elegans]|uniref:F-box associated domain-containing protein n=1 Tax=Caenorhabditis elegans TaxID=6239 RepID=O61804_CAEEL|nr:F-box associated domain-containing protein [Caenorhabditis elegans]CCD61775.2 F-box associated domain-containing protein [Caenorhabditis elegans]|eukprot:NP_508301.2 F-box B protein [Caenorhabditis elegans]